MINLADYLVIRHGEDWQGALGRSDTPRQSTMFDYLFGSNGVFVKASRMFLHACIPVGWCDIRGLAEIDPYVKLDAERVPAAITARALNRAREVCVQEGKPREILFYLIYEDTSETTGEWRLVEPEQVATGASVRPTDESGEDYRRAIIELHSHNEMKAFFSSQDDRDEQGFRIYAVIGNIFTKPKLRVRVGVYGYFYELEAADIFEMPEGLEDAAEIGSKR